MSHVRDGSPYSPEQSRDTFDSPSSLFLIQQQNQQPLSSLSDLYDPADMEAYDVLIAEVRWMNWQDF